MKDKIVGKILVLVLFLSSFIAAKIELNITNMDGNPAEQAVVGEPFILEVKAYDTDSTSAPRIEGLTPFKVHNAGMQICTINNNSSVKHMYKVRCDKAGEYEIGPAVFSINGEDVSSNVVRIKVGTERGRQDHGNKKAAEPFLLLKLDKKEVYVGQKVMASLHFLYADSSVVLDQLTEPEFSSCTIGLKGGPSEEKKTLNGVKYNIITYKFELYPQKVGEYVIPACYADFLSQEKRDRFAGFSLLFGSRTVRKRVYSNAVQLNVQPLPPHDSPVDAVGSFVSYSAQINPPIAKEGEGMVLSLTLEGDGNLSTIKTPQLKNMPTCCKYYDSKSYNLEKTVSGKSGKCFEYIVQVVEGGDFEIPSQEFTYFDTTRQSYITLKTIPLKVTIVPSQGAGVSKNVKKTDVASQKSSVSIVKNEGTAEQNLADDLYPLDKEGAWYEIQQHAMSWKWFFLLIMLSLGYVGRFALRSCGAFLNGRYGAVFTKKHAFTRAKKQIKNLASSGQLYPLFIELIANRAGLPTSSLSQQSIEEILNKAGMNIDELNAWNQFFTMLAAHVYSGQQMREDNHVLLDQAQKWLERLEKVL